MNLLKVVAEVLIKSTLYHLFLDTRQMEIYDLYIHDLKHNIVDEINNLTTLFTSDKRSRSIEWVSLCISHTISSYVD